MTQAHDINRAQVNALIDFYERSKPDAGQRIDLSLSPKQLCKTFDVRPTADENGKETWPESISYRGRTLHALKSK